MYTQTNNDGSFVRPSIFQQQPNSYLLKAPDAAAYLGVSLSWLKQKGRGIPYVRIGIKNKRWRIQDLDAYIAKNVRNAQ